MTAAQNTHVSIPVDELPDIELVANTEWKTVEINGDTEVIPKDWGISSIGQHYDVAMGVTILAKNTTKNPSEGSLPVYSATEKDICFGYVSCDSVPVSKTLKEGDLVIGARGSLGYPKIVSRKSTSTQTTIQAKSFGSYSSEFLGHLCRKNSGSYFCGSGSGVPMLTVRDVSKISIPEPDFHEQTLIAQLLSGQEAQVAALRTQAAVERKRLAWLSDNLLSGRLRVEEDASAPDVVVARDEGGKQTEVLPGLKLVANTEWKTVEVNGEDVEIPEDWSAKTIGDICLLKRNKSASCENYVGMENVEAKTGKFLPGGSGKLVEEATSFTFCHGDILFGKLRPYLRKVWVAEFNGNCSTEFLVLTPSENGGFLRGHLSGDMVSEIAIKNSEGTKMPRTNWQAISSIGIPVPNQEEQNLIAKIISAQENQVSAFSCLASMEQKRLEWLSDELLSGRLRVRIKTPA